MKSLLILRVGEVEVSRIQNVVWKTSALQNLVICDNEKRILTAIITSQLKNKASFDDFVDGKGKLRHCLIPGTLLKCKITGKGIVILLNGPPGVGKTLTAESGEYMQNLICESWRR